jgi:CubicO group peptidase (beta-lactamase class C family)
VRLVAPRYWWSLLIFSCTHGVVAPHASAPSDADVNAMYLRQDWPALQRACEGGFSSGRDPGMAFCAAVAHARQNHGDRAVEWLDRAVRGELGFTLTPTDADFATIANDQRFLAIVRASHERVRARNIANGVGSGIVASSPGAEGIDQAALDTLVRLAGQARTSALVVLRHGKLIGEWYFGGESMRTETMSATKAVSSLAVGALLQDGKIGSIDEPMTTWFAEWKDGVHDAITLRHVLSHTSNLDAPRTAQGVYESGDATHYALGLPMAGPAGGAFFYNNAAVNLIPALVQRVTGKSIEAYLRDRLFGPLGIRDIEWQTDPKGMPLGMSGLRIHAVDFAKLGQLVLQHGSWNGRQLVPETYVEALTRPAQSYKPTSSLLWWPGYVEEGVVFDDAFFASARDKGLPAQVVAKLEPLRGKEIPASGEFAALQRTLGDDWSTIWGAEILPRKLAPAVYAKGAPDELSARGSFDQLLLVYPDRELVVARFTTSFDESHFEASSFEAIDDLARALVPMKHK